MSERQDLIDLVLAIHDGEIDIEDLTDEQTEMAMEGYRVMIDSMKDDPDKAEFVEALQSVLDTFDAEEEADDEFEDAIEEAEARGSTYWEIESDTLH